ncbi:MAG: ABC transporter ATP-binding protein [Candidatus Omnitrophota bacterium]|nr:ABC transporter ATP-binding protein [Candidatus Omnitrophota bacterium]
MKNVLEIRNLFCSYGARRVIDGISFAVEKGEFLGIIGPNGVGKTTLFRAISGLLKSVDGKILFREKNVSEISPRDFASEVAVIPQNLEVPFDFTVEEFVLMGRFSRIGRFESLKKRDYAVLDEVLCLTDTSSLRGRKISELSGGEKQRVIIAQGFAQEPSLLLLDEPTSALDIGHKVRILDLVKRLKKKQALTVVAVFHDLNLAAGYCDRLILLRQGKVFASGAPEEVLTYQNIEEVYKTLVVVKENPISGNPCVFLVSEEERISHEKKRID